MPINRKYPKINATRLTRCFYLHVNKSPYFKYYSRSSGGSPATFVKHCWRRVSTTPSSTSAFIRYYRGRGSATSSRCSSSNFIRYYRRRGSPTTTPSGCSSPTTSSSSPTTVWWAWPGSDITRETASKEVKKREFHYRWSIAANKTKSTNNGLRFRAAKEIKEEIDTTRKNS